MTRTLSCPHCGTKAHRLTRKDFLRSIRTWLVNLQLGWHNFRTWGMDPLSPGFGAAVIKRNSLESQL